MFTSVSRVSNNLRQQLQIREHYFNLQLKDGKLVNLPNARLRLDTERGPTAHRILIHRAYEELHNWCILTHSDQRQVLTS